MVKRSFPLEVEDQILKFEREDGTTVEISNVKTITPPNITWLTYELNGSGMGGPINVPTNKTEQIEMTVVVAGPLTTQNLIEFLSMRPAKIRYGLVYSHMSDDYQVSKEGNKCTATVFKTAVEQSESTPGEGLETTITLSVASMLWQDGHGKVIMQFDKINPENNQINGKKIEQDTSDYLRKQV